MAYTPANTSWEANTSQGQYVWNYSTSDNISVVESSGYFIDAGLPVRTGDILRVTAGNGNTLYQVITGDPSYGATLRKLANVSSFVDNVTGP